MTSSLRHQMTWRHLQVVDGVMTCIRLCRQSLSTDMACRGPRWECQALRRRTDVERTDGRTDGRKDGSIACGHSTPARTAHVPMRFVSSVSRPIYRTPLESQLFCRNEITCQLCISAAAQQHQQQRERETWYDGHSEGCSDQIIQTRQSGCVTFFFAGVLC